LSGKLRVFNCYPITPEALNAACAVQISRMRLVKIVFFAALAAALLLRWQIDKLPDPAFYDSALLVEPEQTPSDTAPFTTQVGDQTYQILPLYNYQLNGVIVSLHDADAFRDIWHHQNWKDFLNIRDLCVMWGNNIRTGIYKNIDFHNDSWTCWARWFDSETNRLFSATQISNNHLLVDDIAIKNALKDARIGDQVQFSGYLAEYRNPANNFRRGTSTVRDDTGNGACETVYLTDFHLIKSANPRIRWLYSMAKWITIALLLVLIVNFIKAPPSRRFK